MQPITTPHPSSSLFAAARPNDKFRCRDGSIVTYIGRLENGFHEVHDGTDTYTVHSNGRMYLGTSNGEPTLSDFDVLEPVTP